MAEHVMDTNNMPSNNEKVQEIASKSTEPTITVSVKEEINTQVIHKQGSETQEVAKTLITFDIKPYDDETDMNAMEEAVRSIQTDGLLWGKSQQVPMAYGINKLQIACVVEDDKVGIDFIEDKINEFEDYVQSVDIAFINKV